MSKKSYCNHESNLEKFVASIKDKKKLAVFKRIQKAYNDYRKVFDKSHNFSDDDVKKMVDALNHYRAIAIPEFDQLSNAGQKALGYTVMEEFFYLFFHSYMKYCVIKHDNLFLGNGNSYVS